MGSPRHSTPNKEEEVGEVATRDDTRGMSALQGGGLIGVKLAPTLPPTAGARRTNELDTRMTTLLEERDRPYETAKETDATDAKETDATEVETTDAKETDVTDATDAKETDTTDAKETDMTDAKETDALTIPLVTSNDLRGLPPSARR